ncbi:MAG TPA: hypothetical protein VGX03_29645 [Candidatus Binatia bacterium]|jgi:hypothetical protein|nr:hypothetical protein [Candidatus Binatia bacterium]
MRSVNVTIADCGPMVKDFCNTVSCCVNPWTVCSVNRIIDLTPAAFTASGGDLAYGLIPTCIDKTITKS